MFDVVYLSYDEPNCEDNYNRLLSIHPAAYRVHGVTGFDAAHKLCATMGNEEHVLVVDGDSWISKNAIAIVRRDAEQLHDQVESWSSINSVNGLAYGNGGLKLWPKHLLLSMQTHEAADPSSTESTDFCWSIPYKQHNLILAESRINGSPYQAWRAGFREGLKMSLDSGKQILPWDASRIYLNNKKRLLTWMMVGADVDNGLWAILGARMGFLALNAHSFSLSSLGSHQVISNIWNTSEIHQFTTDQLTYEIEMLGNQIVESFQLPLALTILSPTHSAFFKQVATHPDRTKWSNPLQEFPDYV